MICSEGNSVAMITVRLEDGVCRGGGFRSGVSGTKGNSLSSFGLYGGWGNFGLGGMDIPQYVSEKE